MVGTVFRPWWRNFINLVYPLSCLICKVRLNPLSDKPLCEICWKKIEYNQGPFCRVCGRHLPAKTEKHALICSDCQSSSFFFRQARSVCVYDGVIKECIHLFKYNSKLSLVKPLSKLMIDFARNYLDMETITLILPVPLHKVKQRQRQFNQAHLLAKSLSRAFAIKLKGSLLVKTKLGPAQVNLTQQERPKNVQSAFRVKDSKVLKDKNVLLIDDVLTTSATVNECSKMLLEAGVNRVEVFTLARSN